MKQFIFITALAYATAAGAGPSVQPRPQDATPQTKTVAQSGVAGPIGLARMLKDRTIVVLAYAEAPGPGGEVSEFQLIFKPGDHQYQELLRHLGGLKPGQSKGIPPWPEKSGVSKQR